MDITLEMVERLKEKANVSYAQAKAALEYSGGNLLDALIYLEEKGAIPRTEGAYYSTRSETPPPPSLCPPSCPRSIKSKRLPRTPSPRGGARGGSSTPCAAGWWTTSWRSGGGNSPSPPCRC